jgi:AcrR family transcriptional regulator
MEKPQPRAAAAPTNRTKILDAGEELFAQLGYEGASVRDITKKAGVGLAMATYYFSSKDQIFEEILLRRFAPLDTARRDMLAAVTRRKDYTVKDVLEAMMEPYYCAMTEGGKGWRNYCRLIAQTAQSNRWVPLVSRHFDPTARLFLQALRRKYAATKDPTLIRAFMLALQLMIDMCAQNERIDHLSKGRVRSDDFRATYESTVAFAAGGIAAMIGKRPKSTKRRAQKRQMTRHWGTS